MRPSLKLVVPGMVLAACALVSALIFIARPKAEPQPRPAVAPLVRSVVVERTAVELDVRTQGTVAPRTEIDLVPEVSGRITALAADFADGAFFSKGDVLVRIDPRDYRLAVDRAQAAVAQARVRLAQEEAEAEVAQREWAQLGKGPAPPLVVREPQLAEARAAVDAALANLEEAKLDLARTQIRAEFDGRVRSESVDVGQYVLAGQAIARVYAIDVAEIRLPLPNDQLAFLDLHLGYRGDESVTGPTVQLTAEFAGENHQWSGRIVRSEGELDPRSRMVHVVARVDDPYGRSGEDRRPPLAVGMFVRAHIRGRTIPDAIVLRRSALRDGNRVLVIDDEDRLRFRDVEVARAERDRIIITEGLEAGERVCVSALETVVDGMPVRPVADHHDDADRTAVAPATGGRAVP